MEAEREREWKATEEEGDEEEAAAEESGGGLMIRKRNRGRMGIETEEKAVNGGEGDSVFFDEDKGVWKCRHCIWTYHLSGLGIDVIRKLEGNCQVVMDVETLIQLGTHADSPTKGANVINGSNGLKFGETNELVAEENIGNGIANVGATKLNGHHNLKTGVTGNGLNSQLSFEKWSGNGSTRSENEIKEDERLEPEESNKFLAEYDLQRVLDEQETHDLICPNCNSCITKRVILRKRKRTLKENTSELPGYKVPRVPETIPATCGPIKHEDKTAFRCLNCFSIFIPTEYGCNIFRIFWKGDGSNNLGRSEGKPAKNWVFDLFRSGSSNLEGVPSPAVTDTAPSSEQPLGPKEYPSVTTCPGTADLEDMGTTNGINHTGVPLPAATDTVPGREQYVGSNENHTLTPTPVTADLGGNGTTSGINNAGSSAGGSYSNGGIVGNQAQGAERTEPEGNDTIKPIKFGRLHGQPIDLSANNSMPTASGYLPLGNNINEPVSTIKPTSPKRSAESNQNVRGPETPADTHIDMGVHGREESRNDNDWDVLKSIVYGGLIESITSLGVVSSAAGSGSTTLNICALGIANLIGGLFVISHDISELRSAHDAEAANRREKRAGRYWEKLGKREHFRRHAFFAILSYIVFGLLPPVIYGLTFRESDNKEYKIIAAAASSLLSVALLAIGKAHVRSQKDYIKSLCYYIVLALPASGLSYVAGMMVNRLFVELGLFDATAASPAPPSSLNLIRFGSGSSSWASL